MPKNQAILEGQVSQKRDPLSLGDRLAFRPREACHASH